ncbi:MAG: tripartite tricarboxylate transporter permease [Pseudomonadota bacterium]
MTLLTLVLGGVLIGYLIGALPGFDITTGVALMLPLSYVMEQSHALAFFSAMYCAGVFGGSITAILFRIPGTSESVMSAVEGHPFTQSGQAARALGLAVLCSGLAGVLATCVLIGLAPWLASLALKFGPGDYAALGVLGCAAVIAGSGGNLRKGVLALSLGLLVSTVGADPFSGEPRFVVSNELRDGVGLIPAIIGLFAAGDVLWRLLVSDIPGVSADRVDAQLNTLQSLKDWAAVRWTFARAWLLGLATGVLPGAGASSAAFLAHSVESRISPGRRSFGQGSLHGLAAPETAKNAAAVGSLIPLLALGIPGSGTAAVILGAFEIHNLQVGPLLFAHQPAVVSTIFFAVMLANVLFVVTSPFVIRPFARMTRLPYPFMATMILTLSVGGCLATGGVAAAQVMLGFAVVGVCLRLLNIPLAPVILGVVLGPIIELYTRRGLLLSDGHVGSVFSSSISVSLLAASLLLVLLPAIGSQWWRRREASSASGER